MERLAKANALISHNGLLAKCLLALTLATTTIVCIYSTGTLLGFNGAAMSGFLVSIVSVLNWTVLSRPRTWLIRAGAMSLLAMIVACSVFPELLGGYFGDTAFFRRMEVQVTKKVVDLVHSKEDFSRIVIKSDVKKVLHISLVGAVRSQDVLFSFRELLYERCPELSREWVDWDIYLDVQERRLSGSDAYLLTLKE